MQFKNIYEKYLCYESEKSQCYIMKCNHNYTKTICTEKEKPRRKYTEILSLS